LLPLAFTTYITARNALVHGNPLALNRFPFRSLHARAEFPILRHIGSKFYHQVYTKKGGGAMDLKEYFTSTNGLGVLSTADEKGKVNAAVYSKPQVIDDTHVPGVRLASYTI
jgi:hypothetical protein